MVFLGAGARSSLAGESLAAWEWLQSRPEVDARYLQLADLPVASLAHGAIVWFHHARSPELPSTAMRPEALDTVRAHLQGGGGLLLSLMATPWAVPLGLETRPPNRIEEVPGTDFVRWSEDDDRLLTGFQSYRGHPVLRRFWGGTYTSTPGHARRYAVARYEGDAWPERGRVVAVEKRYIGLATDRRTLVEYPSGPERSGRVIAAGEGLWFDDPGNRNREQLETFTLDLFTYLAGDLPPAPHGATIPSTGATALPATETAGDTSSVAPPLASEERPQTAPTAAELPELLAATSYWTPSEREVRRLSVSSETAPMPASGAGLLEAVTASRSGLLLEAPASSAVPFDLYGPRTLLTGTQAGHVDDLWTYPNRALRELDFALLGPDGTLLRLDDPDAVRTFVARPEGDTLRVTKGALSLTLHLAVQRERGGMVALLEFAAPGPARLLAAWEADHGLMWPREAEHLGDLLLGWDDTSGAALWRDGEGHFHAIGGFGRQPDAVVVGGGLEELLTEIAGPVASAAEEESSAEPAPAQETPGDGESEADTPGAEPAGGAVDETLPSARVAVSIPVDPSRDVVVPFVVTAGPEDDERTRSDWRAALEDPAAVWSDNANYWRQFLGDTVDIATPDPTFDEAFRWAKVGLEAFRARTPGLGTGLAAGYAASRDPEVDTWHAENDFLRRPGYGWYFGRDAIWTALAADAYGGLDLTSETLRFLARYQDVDGKIFHELSPSGVIHYDAADSTPLFLLGLEHHVRTSGDRELLRTLWPAVRRAVAFLETTDTDGDGLIENTGVGHGWIEGGRFYGAHTTFYLASLQAATFEAVERMAGWVPDDELAATMAGRGARTREILERDFWDPLRRTYQYGKRADGGYMPIRTILPAVGMSLEVLNETRVRPLLDLFAGSEISTDWGSRMAERSNPDYNPEGYHDGSVWPLYTGWTSLAAYRNHRPLQAFSQLYANLRLYRAGSLGHMPEVLHGERFEAIGVTQHQAWSQAMALLPAVEGMLGVRTDAMAGRLRLHPHLPAGWNRVVVTNLRMGEHRFKVTLVREEESTRFEIERTAGGDPVQLELSLPFPRSVLVNLDRDATQGVVLVDPETIVDRASEKEARVVVTPTESTAVVVFRHSPYPQVVPPVNTPEPGAESQGLRLIDSEYRNRQLTVRLEGLPGRTYRFLVATPWPVTAVVGVPGAAIAIPGPGRATIELRLPGESTAYQRAELRIDFGR